MHFCRMLRKLQERWKVNGINLVLIITTFALGGSLCGWAGRKLLLLTHMEKGFAWLILYIILITILWPICVLLISVPLGQFSFFRKYILKIWSRMSGEKKAGHQSTDVIRIAIFASGAGSNAKKIIEYFSNTKSPAKTALIVCNNPTAGVLNIARENGIPVLLIERERFVKGDAYLPELKKAGIDYIILAGFLWKLPFSLVDAYPKKIINIHPALLPKYGGKGMYGHHVHEAVISNKEKQSGISIHFADELYDHGEVIFQASCELTDTDTVETLTKKIQQLEHMHYPVVIETVLKKQNPR